MSDVLCHSHCETCGGCIPSLQERYCNRYNTLSLDSKPPCRSCLIVRSKIDGLVDSAVVQLGFAVLTSVGLCDFPRGAERGCRPLWEIQDLAYEQLHSHMSSF